MTDRSNRFVSLRSSHRMILNLSFNRLFSLNTDMWKPCSTNSRRGLTYFHEHSNQSATTLLHSCKMTRLKLTLTLLLDWKCCVIKNCALCILMYIIIHIALSEVGVLPDFLLCPIVWRFYYDIIVLNLLNSHVNDSWNKAELTRILTTTNPV